jgi:hypothetical protein
MEEADGGALGMKRFEIFIKPGTVPPPRERKEVAQQHIKLE